MGMRENIKKIINAVTVILFVLTLFTFLILTVHESHAGLEYAIKQQKNAGTLSVNSLETILKQQLFGKDAMAEVSGTTKLLLGKRLSDDKQYFRGQQGMIHLNYGWRDYNRMLYDVDDLSARLLEENVPFLLCQVAERAEYPDGFSHLFSGNSLDYIQPLKTIVQKNEGLYFDYSDYFDVKGVDEHGIFFKTDLHYTTQAEFSVFTAILQKLEQEAGIVFENATEVSSIENYVVEERPFLGNLGRTTGSIYSLGADRFAHYVPKFDTDMAFVNHDGTVQKSGSFEQVVMNGYRGNAEADQYTYWVTDYLQFTNPSYTIVNHQVDNNNILVIADSMAFRTISYLTLACHSVTILDPRYFSNVDYLGLALEQDYDAVICFASVNLSGAIGGYDAEVKSINYATDDMSGEKKVSVMIQNTGTRVWSNHGICVCGLIGSQDVGIKIGFPQNVTVQAGDSYEFVFRESDFPALFEANADVQFVMHDSYWNLYFGK